MFCGALRYGKIVPVLRWAAATASSSESKQERSAAQSDSAPYTDFGVWGPFGRRQSKLLKYQAQIFVGGELQTKLMTGPPNFESWRKCWRG